MILAVVTPALENREKRGHRDFGLDARKRKRPSVIHLHPRAKKLENCETLGGREAAFWPRLFCYFSFSSLVAPLRRWREMRNLA